MKSKSILYIIITCLSLYHTNGFASYHTNDTNTMTDSSSDGYGSFTVLGLVAVVGYIALSNKADDADEVLNHLDLPMDMELHFYTFINVISVKGIIQITICKLIMIF